MVHVMKEDEHNRVVELFKDKTLFITGGTGFLGKVLIEKLLRCCTDLKKIYMLIRPKKGKDVAERLELLFDGPLFDMLRKQQAKGVFSKVEGIEGDVSAPGLGLSEENRRKLTSEVEIIYHSAATVRFDEPFKSAVLINVRGAKLMLALAKECTNLLVYCHVSTAYCHEEQEVLLEKTYPPPCDPHRIIDMVEWLDDKTLELLGDRIRGTNANNYTFTKALGEGLVNEQMENLPVIIQRPSAVVPIYLEPLPGWTDNINGPTGLLIGAGKGVIRTMYGRGDNFADYVPVDFVASALICTVYDYLTNKNMRVYNVTASDEHKLTFQEVLDIGRKLIEKVPFDWVLWYPGGSLYQSKLIHNIAFVLFQLVPAVLVDCILFLIGVKPVLIKIQKRIYRGYDVLEYYCNRKWDFKKDGGKARRNTFNAKERAMFPLQADPDYYEYFLQCMLGARRYILNEPDENLPAARRRIKVMWCLDKICKILLVYGLLYFIYQKFLASFF